ncbi:7b7a30aa-ac15-4fb9-9d5f-cf1dc3944848 [Sclerotinia trifoliorum]|uniref:7b7a30aa-ac15-4fb9-9d5f-cf1dc3944848 n=1 Tax=Sclerotinia trifoliorum TaxID=28548 RepID=A0A8H2VUI1_9HELO|nr:7b7a30aa-ac15-4fb9-9d5f-cf1dc3944848 [Sclerotinia trifoliorum]
MATECAVCHNCGIEVRLCSQCRSHEYCGNDCQTRDWPTHKASCMRQNFILRVDLSPRYLTNPRVTRTISCPATASFADLHNALQVSFGWKSCHLHHFRVLDHSETMGSDSILSPRSILFMISAPGMLPEEATAEPIKCSSRTLLHQVLDSKATKGKTIHYQYDYGDNWEHVIICGGRADPTANFVVLGGEGHGCAEDVGGHSGWNDLIKAYEADRPTIEQQELMTWFEETALNKDPGGLRGAAKYKWDKDGINAVLEGLNMPEIREKAVSILLISLAKESWFDEVYASVLGKLRSKAAVKEVTEGASAVKHVEKSIHKYSVIIVTDTAIMEPQYFTINEHLVHYVNSGGTLIFGFLMPSFADPHTFDCYFRKIWGPLNWKSGNYIRDTYKPNSQTNLPPHFQGQLKSYSMKAVSLENVKPEDRVYCGGGRQQSPAIFAKYGSGSNGSKQGHVGWLGDVNMEEGMTALLLAMCGL